MEDWLFFLVNLAYLWSAGYTMRYISIVKPPQFRGFLLWLGMCLSGYLFHNLTSWGENVCRDKDCALFFGMLGSICSAVHQISLTILLCLRALASHAPPLGSKAARVVAVIFFVFFVAVNSVPSLVWGAQLMTEVKAGRLTSEDLFFYPLIVGAGLLGQCIVYLCIFIVPFIHLKPSQINQHIGTTIIRHMAVTLGVGFAAVPAYVVPSLLGRLGLLSSWLSVAYLVGTLIISVVLTQGLKVADTRKVNPSMANEMGTGGGKAAAGNGRHEMSLMFSRGAAMQEVSQAGNGRDYGANRRSETPFPENDFMPDAAHPSAAENNLNIIAEGDEEEDEEGGGGKRPFELASEAEQLAEVADEARLSLPYAV
jgi:hypothetical protein